VALSHSIPIGPSRQSGQACREYGSGQDVGRQYGEEESDDQSLRGQIRGVKVESVDSLYHKRAMMA